ncbi:MAG: FixH family protein, partial [Polyangiaceae bacterium]
ASSTNANSFSAAPLMSLTSDRGALHVDVRTSPTQPPTRGEQSVQLVITNADGSPSTDLALSTKPWMPAMGHGASVTPSVSETAPGTYVIEDVDMFMPGTWELRTTISSASDSNDTDHVAPAFQIP